MVLGRAWVMCAAWLQDIVAFWGYTGCPLCPEPPFSGDEAKGLKTNHLMGTPQSQPCLCHLCCLAACPAVVPAVWPEGPRLQCQGGFPGTLVPLRPHTPTTVPQGRRTPENKTVSSGSEKHKVKHAFWHRKTHIFISARFYFPALTSVFLLVQRSPGVGDAPAAARQGRFLYKGSGCDQLLGKHRRWHSLDQCWELIISVWALGNHVIQGFLLPMS